jgi:hypothetical protein
MYNVINTCALDTSLQMIYFLWLRVFVPHDVMEKDPLLSQTMKCIHKGKYGPARHNVLPKMLPNIKRSTDGKEETWICTSNMMDNRPFPTLFKPKRPLVQRWESCSKMKESCPFHKDYQKPITRYKAPRAIIVPLKNGRTVQESINDEYGSLVKACERTENADFVEGDEECPPDKLPEVNRVVNSCPEKGMQQRTFVATIDSWPRVIIIRMTHQDHIFPTPKDIPQSVLFPPDIPFCLGSVILTNASHFRGISVDAKKNSNGIHILYDGMDSRG